MRTLGMAVFKQQKVDDFYEIGEELGRWVCQSWTIILDYEEFQYSSVAPCFVCSTSFLTPQVLFTIPHAFCPGWSSCVYLGSSNLQTVGLLKFVKGRGMGVK